MKKRILSAAVALTLVLTMLAGCSGGSGNNTPTGGNGGNNSPTNVKFGICKGENKTIFVYPGYMTMDDSSKHIEVEGTDKITYATIGGIPFHVTDTALYLADYDHGFCMYDLSGNQPPEWFYLSSDSLCCLPTVSGEWIYYIASDKSGNFHISKMKLDGTDNQQIMQINSDSTKPFLSFFICDGWMYWAGEGLNSQKLFRARLDGSDIHSFSLKATEKLYDDWLLPIFSYDKDYLYYIVGGDYIYIYRTSLDFSSTEKLFTFDSSDMEYKGFYYADGYLLWMGDDSLYSVTLSGTKSQNKTDVNPEIAESFNFFLGNVDGFVYLLCGDYLLKVRPDGTDLQVVLSDLKKNESQSQHEDTDSAGNAPSSGYQ